MSAVSNRENLHKPRILCLLLKVENEIMLLIIFNMEIKYRKR